MRGALILLSFSDSALSTARNGVALLLVAALLGSAAALVLPPAVQAASPAPVVITVRASRYAFEPGVLHVQQGQTVTLRLEATDVSHGLALPNYGIELHALPGRPAEATFVARRGGRFSFRCVLPCGELHPFMVGTLVVEPYAGLRAAAGIAFPLACLAALVGGGVLLPARPNQAAGAHRRRGWDLLRLGWLRSLLTSRWPLFLLSLVTLGGMMAVIVAGFLGSPLGSHNAGIVFVWILWWALLAIVLLPWGGRAWCAVCPLPLPGEWLQRRALVSRRLDKAWALGLPWPRRLRNGWLQTGALLGLAILSAAFLTRPVLTAGFLALMLLVATCMALVFRDRAFCRYLCPVGGFIGLYSLAAPLGLRCRDRSVCEAHGQKECLVGSEGGYGCPWGVYLGNLERNPSCGLCFECVRACSRGNVGLYLRRPGADLLGAERDYGEALRAAVLLGSAALYSAVDMGPWGWLKASAWPSWRPAYFLYALGFLWLCLVGLPGLLWVTAWLGRKIGGLTHDATSLALDLAYSLVPLGLMAWLAFSLSFALANGSYVLVALSDPLGYGWNLLGTRDLPGQPLLPGPVLQNLQAAVVLLGLGWSVWLAGQRLLPAAGQGSRALLALLPVSVVWLGFGLVFLWLYLGA